MVQANISIPSFGSPTLENFDSNIQDGVRLGGQKNRQFVRFYKKMITVIKALEVSINPKTGSTRVLKSAPVQEEREFVEIITPGDKNTVDDVAQDFHKREHFRHYAAFRDGKSTPMGTPIEDSTFVPPSLVTELLYLGVKTVEQLADASDLLCDRVANGWDLREFARSVCKANLDNKSQGQVNLLRSELEKSQSVIAEMQEQMRQMQSMIVAPDGNPYSLQAPIQNVITPEVSPAPVVAKRSPGRPKKTE